MAVPAKLFVDRQCKHCNLAKHMLERVDSQFTVIDVRASGLTGHIGRDLGVNCVPVLVTPDRIYSGIKGIEQFIAELPSNSNGRR
jgi:glutaredoxin